MNNIVEIKDHASDHFSRRKRLCELIRKWNARQFDLFQLTQPDEVINYLLYKSVRHKYIVYVGAKGLFRKS